MPSLFHIGSSFSSAASYWWRSSTYCISWLPIDDVLQHIASLGKSHFCGLWMKRIH
jgi:hypothetical protein